MKTLLRYTWGGYIKHQGGRDGGDGAEQEGRKKLKRREGRNGTEERMIGTQQIFGRQKGRGEWRKEGLSYRSPGGGQ